MSALNINIPESLEEPLIGCHPAPRETRARETFSSCSLSLTKQLHLTDPDQVNTMSEQLEDEDNRRIIPVTSTSCRLVRILCFDAGGAGCVSSLAILRKIMHPGGPDDPNDPNGPPRLEPNNLYPCRHFELFCGSEWGAVLAIMLGRLRMVGRDAPSVPSTVSCTACRS